MAYLELADARRLFFTDEGEGPAMLFIHGWSCSGADWAWAVTDFMTDHRVVVPDNRGHGASDPADAYSPKLFAEDAAALLEHLNITSAIVVGHSMGTLTGSALAVEHPDLVDALVLVDPVYNSPAEVLDTAVLPAIKQAPHETAVATFANFYCDATPSWLPAWHRRRLLSTSPDVVRDAFVSLYEGEDGIGRDTISHTYLPRRQAPVLAIYAGDEQRAAWERTILNGTHDDVRVWPDNGHFLHQEDPTRFAREVREWLDSLT